MSNDLVLIRTRDLMPVTLERGHDLSHVPEIWGLYPGVMPHVPLDREPPTRDVLLAMQDELASALVPVKAHAQGLLAVAGYASQLTESFPMRDNAGSRYADALVERLQECPPDLLPKVVRKLIDECDFRPSAKQVLDAVKEVLARRRLLLMRVQAGLRYWDWKAEQRAIEAEKAARVSVKSVTRALAPPRHQCTIPVKAEPVKREVKPRPLDPQHLANERALAAAKTQSR
jgi:hypothetical protein